MKLAAIISVRIVAVVVPVMVASGCGEGSHRQQGKQRDGFHGSSSLPVIQARHS